MEIKVRVPRFKDGKPDGFNFHTLTSSGKSYSFGNCHFLGDYEVKQPELWSCLLDKNDTEIYENDIVHLQEYAGEILMPVLFKNGSFCIHGFNFNPKKCVVVGNLHENADLIH